MLLGQYCHCLLPQEVKAAAPTQRSNYENDMKFDAVIQLSS